MEASKTETEITKENKTDPKTTDRILTAESTETEKFSPVSKKGFITFLAFLTKTLQVINTDKNDDAIFDAIIQVSKLFLNYDVNITHLKDLIEKGENPVPNDQ